MSKNIICLQNLNTHTCKKLYKFYLRHLFLYLIVPTTVIVLSHMSDG